MKKPDRKLTHTSTHISEDADENIGYNQCHDEFTKYMNWVMEPFEEAEGMIVNPEHWRRMALDVLRRYKGGAVTKGKFCKWTWDTDGYHRTGCGNSFLFSEGGPKDNEFEYCPYCGERIEEEENETP